MYITINLSKIYCIPGSNSKKLRFTHGKIYPQSPSFLRFTPCENFIFAPLPPWLAIVNLRYKNFFKMKVVVSSEICILMNCSCSYADTFWHLMLTSIEPQFVHLALSNEILNKYFSTLDVKMYQHRNNFSHWSRKKFH